MGASQRHWHSAEDEFVYVLEGELTLIEDGGETLLHAGDCAAFPKGSESCQIAWCYRVKLQGPPRELTITAVGGWPRIEARKIREEGAS